MKLEEIESKIANLELMEMHLKETRSLYRTVYGTPPTKEFNIFSSEIQGELDKYYAQRARLQREATQNA